MAFDFSVPGPTGATPFSIPAGTSIIFVGSNGGGKTRLAVEIENQLQLRAHRISAHRALSLNPHVEKTNQHIALKGLRTGHAHENAFLGNRVGSRWHGDMATAMLNDFDFLLQSLFAEQTNKTLETHRRVRAGDTSQPELTSFERLADIWQRLIPHRVLEITGDDIRVRGAGVHTAYSAKALSDGERSVFYMIGQVLAADADTLFIFDEPELHIHRSIMAKLWDELESARPDCAFVFITHDLEFAASRIAQKFLIRDYIPETGWTIEPVPEETGFDEEITTLILGSRRPVLFVEGGRTSLDDAIYRCCYPERTVIPRGSCEEVIHSVVTMRANAKLTRVTCSGIVDSDDYSEGEITYLSTLGVAVLPVSEIENLLLLPDVGAKIAEHEGYAGDALDARLQELRVAVMASVTTALAESAAARYCRRRIDRTLKKIDLSAAKSIAEIAADYAAKTGALDVTAIGAEALARISTAVSSQDIVALAQCYDNKGLMALVARHLKNTNLSEFEMWLTRALRNNIVPALTQALRQVLPQIQPR
ncbi:ABC transporter ATP-binding protein [Rhizobium ruizarguesonis]|nr:ABC transporter ATP-binding protein [Rhizobium ruizarguesonis]TAU71143.1 ABC transporter ATP-binding protein [Rhizobium ruizarguesonis]TAV18278.1 ABC transporter ATP-binding protein [Rhizobium ruizarguesonis]TAV30518.1 ABC transporter ATP-binding protein [Rhizobium ruizarguesonis]TAW12455.1 ABC transporter ATP-binding protein [Rhizobium ruizarguesonis]